MVKLTDIQSHTQLCSYAVNSAMLLLPLPSVYSTDLQLQWCMVYQVKAASSVERDVIAWADSEVMGDEEGVLKVELFPCHPLPLLIKLSHINGHLQTPGLHLTVKQSKHVCPRGSHAVSSWVSLSVCTWGCATTSLDSDYRQACAYADSTNSAGALQASTVLHYT